jgi:hypothetical protein
VIAIRLQVENAEALTVPWRVALKAMGVYVGMYALALVKEIRKAAPKGEQHIHPLSTRAPRNRNMASKWAVVKRNLQAGKDSFALVGPKAVDYARHVLFGTKPHQIDIRRAKTLTIWKPEGLTTRSGLVIAPDKYGFVHVKSVRHPGNKPNDFRVTAISALVQKGTAGALWRKAFEKCYSAWNGAGRFRTTPGGVKATATPL